MQCFMNALIENFEINTWNFISLNVKKKTNKKSKVACFEFFTCAAAFVLQSKV